MSIQHLNPASQAAAVDDMARRLVSQDVRYCVSALVGTLARREWDGSDGIDPDDLATIMQREPDADDFREAARDRDLFDAPAAAGAAGASRIAIERDADADGVFWRWSTTDDDGDAQGGGEEETEALAWRAAFDDLGEDWPEGSECLEHWLVTDDLARRLRAEGEAVADDVAGLTIWGRCTSGQAIYADGIMQRIARAILEA